MGRASRVPHFGFQKTDEFPNGASGRIRTFVGLRPTDLQSVVIDHSTTDACIQNNTKSLFLHLFFFTLIQLIYAEECERTRIGLLIFSFLASIRSSLFFTETETVSPFFTPLEIMKEATGFKILFWIKRLRGLAP